MPCYDYECCNCGQVEEVYHRMHDKPKVLCDICGARMEKAISVPYVDTKEHHDWSNENGGRGRRQGCLATSMDDHRPEVYCKNRQELKDKLRRKGMDLV